MEKNEKKCQIHLIESKDKFNGMIAKDSSGYDKELGIINNVAYQHEDYIGHYIYVTSDDEIKEGDWCYHLGFNRIEMWKNDYHSTHDISLRRKIIATTDKSLVTKIFSHFSQDLMKVSVYKDIHLPQPSESFIQKYIECYNKEEIIKEVMVEYEKLAQYGKVLLPCSPHNNEQNSDMSIYKDYLKVNLKDNTITIRKIKDSYSREELFPIIKKALNTKGVFNDEYTYKWIENNL